MLEIPHDHFHKTNTDPTRWTVCTYRNYDEPGGHSEPCNHPYNDTMVFAFQAPAWTEARFETRILSKVFRQTDETWIRTLNQLKTSTWGEEAETVLRRLTRPLASVGDLLPTMLYAHRASVEDMNLQKNSELAGEEMTVTAFDEGSVKYPREISRWPMDLQELGTHGESCSLSQFL